jgi:hypothetical protein
MPVTGHRIADGRFGNTANDSADRTANRCPTAAQPSLTKISATPRIASPGRYFDRSDVEGFFCTMRF